MKDFNIWTGGPGIFHVWRSSNCKCLYLQKWKYMGAEPYELFDYGYYNGNRRAKSNDVYSIFRNMVILVYAEILSLMFFRLLAVTI